MVAGVPGYSVYVLLVVARFLSILVSFQFGTFYYCLVFVQLLLSENEVVSRVRNSPPRIVS